MGIFFRWNDNSLLTIASNHQTHFPIAQTRRRVKGASQCLVKQPHLIKQYNEGMGGVDLMDRLLGTYRPRILGKKWYWPLFLNALNISVVAAWRIHTQFTDNNLSHLEFRSNVSLCLLKSVPSSAPSKGLECPLSQMMFVLTVLSITKSGTLKGGVLFAKKYYVSMCQMLGAPSF